MASCFSRGPLHSSRPRWKKTVWYQLAFPINTQLSLFEGKIPENMVPRWKAGVLFHNDFVWRISQPFDFCMLYFSVGLMCTASVNLLTTVQRLTVLKGYPTWGSSSNRSFVHTLFTQLHKSSSDMNVYGKNQVFKEDVNAFNTRKLSTHILNHIQLHPSFPTILNMHLFWSSFPYGLP